MGLDVEDMASKYIVLQESSKIYDIPSWPQTRLVSQWD
jgi:hypothetical protein